MLLIRLDCRLINKHDRNVVADGINAPAFRALETLAVFRAMNQRFLAGGANQNVEQILRNHESILRWTMGSGKFL